MKANWLKLIMALALVGGIWACPVKIHAQETNSSDGQPVYVVQGGDTLLNIATRFGVTIESLARANGLPTTKILIGQKLIIPPTGEPAVLTNTTLLPGDVPHTGQEAMKFIDPELRLLVESTRTNWNAGKTNTSDIGNYVQGFEDLLGKHPGEKTEAVAQILFAEENFFFEALGDGVTGSKLLHQLAENYPDTKLGRDIEKILNKDESDDAPTPVSLAGNPWTMPRQGGFTLSPIKSFVLGNDCVLARFLGAEQTNLVVVIPDMNRTNERVGVFSTDFLNLNGVARISRDGSRLPTFVNPATIQLRNAFTHEPVGAPLRHAAPVDLGEFSPDNRLLATAAGGVVQLWNALDGRPVGDHIVQKQVAARIIFSRDSSRLCLAASNSVVTVWDVRTGRQVGKAFKCSEQGWREAHESTGAWTVFSPDGRTLLDGIGPYWLWNVETGTRSRYAINVADKIFGIEFSPDSKRVVTTAGAGERSAQVWDAETGRPVTKPLHHYHSVFTAHFLPDGRRFVTTSLDGDARIWDSTTGKLLVLCVHPDADVPIAELSPDGRYLITLGGKTARIWSTETGELLAKPIEFPSEVTGATFSADSTELLTVTDTDLVQIWKLAR